MNTKAWMDNKEVKRIEELRKIFILFEHFDNGVNLDAENPKINSE